MNKVFVDWSGASVTPWELAHKGTKAKNITSCDNAFVTNIVLARDPGASVASEAAHLAQRKPTPSYGDDP